MTTQEIRDLLKIVDDSIMAHRPGVGSLTSASVNGKTFTYSTNTNANVSSMSTLLSQRNDLRKALADATGNPILAAGTSSRATAVFRGGYAPPGCSC